MIQFLCQFGFLAAMVSGCPAEGGQLAGYVEGEYVQLAPIETAHVSAILTHRAVHVNRGEKLALLENADAKLALDQAEAQLLQAQSDLANLRLGRRNEEIAVVEAALNQAKARASNAALTFQRQQELLSRRVVAQAVVDSAQTDFNAALAEVEQQKANLAVAQLPARPDEISAAENRVKQAMAARDEAAWRVAQREIVAPGDGMITTIIRKAGETAGPTAAVLEFLPDHAVKLVVYVPEKDVARFAIGTPLDVRCDGCPDGLTAKVSWRATEAEFTPPVIYSVEARQKLVYLVEAKPDVNSAAHLLPGQIVDVSLAQQQ